MFFRQCRVNLFGFIRFAILFAVVDNHFFTLVQVKFGIELGKFLVEQYNLLFMLERHGYLLFGYFKIGFCGFQALYRSFLSLRKLFYEVLQTRQITACAFADVHSVLSCARKRYTALVR